MTTTKLDSGIALCYSRSFNGWYFRDTINDMNDVAIYPSQDEALTAWTEDRVRWEGEVMLSEDVRLTYLRSTKQWRLYDNIREKFSIPYANREEAIYKWEWGEDEYP